MKPIRTTHVRSLQSLCLAASVSSVTAIHAAPPEDFVSLSEFAPDIRLDIRYYTENNFVGKRLDGYDAPKCLITRPAAKALKDVQAELTQFNLQLVVFDCYRPQATVDHFVRWAKDLQDLRTQAAYYPNVPKNELFSRGYIAERSGHSRGSTVDVTIDGLDMGTPFDFFDETSHPHNPTLPLQVRANRAFLAKIMQGAGFRGLPEEWWHFTLNNEPYPERYFNFPVK